MPQTRGPFDQLATAAGLVFLADFATKQWALASLPPSSQFSSTGWHLAVVNNTHLAGGVETGGFDLPLTFVVTVVIAFLVLRICRPLTAVDASAPTTLGLIIGAGAGNLADALIPPHGVVDFIAFTSPEGLTTSFNVADVVLLGALVLSIRTAWRIVLAIRGRAYNPRRAPRIRPSGALVMRDRLLVSAGHALLAMCGFIWLYSMAIAMTADAGRSAPNALLCGVGVFGVAFLLSQARQRMAVRQLVARPRPMPSLAERVILDGSIPIAPLTDMPARRPVPRPGVIPTDDRRPERGDRF
jgi:lipoprotein signal peptidase